MVIGSVLMGFIGRFAQKKQSYNSLKSLVITVNKKPWFLYHGLFYA